jgi:hydroxymethylpyrimidine/phosphomethylpyrimidine kinase
MRVDTEKMTGRTIKKDIKTFSALGVYGMSVLTAVTAQNTLGVQGLLALPAEFVRLQIDAVMSDIGADAVKTGMLANADTIAVIAERVRHWGVGNLVVDPVMVATSGDSLLQQDAQVSLVRDLLPLARVVTPNLPEARALTGLKVGTIDEMRQAAVAIHDMGPRNVLIKGGHLAAAKDDGSSSEAVDVFYDGQDFIELSSPQIATNNTHGTGCTLASAIAVGLAKGHTVAEAVRFAKEYLNGALVGSQRWRLGSGHGPVDHFWCLPTTAP